METINWIFVGIGLIGTALNIFKNKWCFIVWGIANIGFITINCYREIYSMALFFFVNFLTCIWGWIQWKREEWLKDPRKQPWYNI